MKSFFTVLLLAACSCLQAQKVDLDKFIFTAAYQEFPNAPIDTSYHTYSVSVTGSTGTPALGSPATSNQVNESDLIERISIQGWKKLPKSAHVNINTAFEPVVMRNWEVKERVQLSKGKTDKDTIRTTYYHIEITYSFAATSEMKDYKGNSIWREEVVSPESKQVYKTQEFSSIIEATFYFKYQASTELEKMSRFAVESAMNKLNNSLSYNFGYYTRTVNDIMWILDSKKHPEYEAHRKAWLLARQSFFQMQPSQSVDEIRKMIDPAIAYFQRIPKKYNSNSKWDRKMRYASYFNLAKIYYYLDEPDASMNEAGNLIMNGYDAGDGKLLEQMAMNLKATFAQKQRNSRHFAITPELYTGPYIAPPAKVVATSLPPKKKNK
jgi:hypothetical protein